MLTLTVNYCTALNRQNTAGVSHHQVTAAYYLILSVLLLFDNIEKVWVNLFQRCIQLLWPLQNNKIQDQDRKASLSCQASMILASGITP